MDQMKGFSNKHEKFIIERTEKKQMFKIFNLDFTSRTDSIVFPNLPGSLPCPHSSMKKEPKKTRMLHSGGESPNGFKPVSPLLLIPMNLPLLIKFILQRSKISFDIRQGQESSLGIPLDKVRNGHMRRRGTPGK